MHRFTLANIRMAILVLPLSMVLFAACSEMQEPASPQQQSANTVVQLDPGVTLQIPQSDGLNKAFSTASYPSLSGCSIAYDMSHNTGRQGQTAPSVGNGNSTIFGDLTARGATITEITTFDLATLNQYDVLWMEEDWNTVLSAGEKSLLLSWVTAGGSLFIYGDNWGYFTAEIGSPLHPFGYSYTSHHIAGTTTNIASHDITSGVSSINFGSSDTYINVPSGSTVLVRDPSDSYDMAAISQVGMGKLAVLTDDIFYNGQLGQADNRVFANNLMTWLCVRSVNISVSQSSINCNNANGNIVITIYSEPGFDATTIDHTTVMFEGAGERHVNSMTSVAQRHESDVNNDGAMDLVFHFRFGDTGLDCSSTSGTLTGMFYGGGHFMGTTSLTMHP